LCSKTTHAIWALASEGQGTGESGLYGIEMKEEKKKGVGKMGKERLSQTICATKPLFAQQCPILPIFLNPHN